MYIKIQHIIIYCTRIFKTTWNLNLAIASQFVERERETERERDRRKNTVEQEINTCKS